MWFRLNEFSLLMATVIASMKNFMRMKMDDEMDLEEVRGSGDAAEEMAGDKEDGDGVEGQKGEMMPAWAGGEGDGKGMMKVLAAFEMLRKEFDEKFKVMWA